MSHKSIERLLIAIAATAFLASAAARLFIFIHQR